MTTLGIGAVRTAWTGLRTEAADGVPVVGFDAEAPGFFWLAGQGGYGFQTSSGIAELAAAQILAGPGPPGGNGQQSGIPDSGCAGRDALVHPALKNGFMSTLITNIAELMTQDLEHRVLKNAAVVIEGERIAWIGSAADAPAADDAVDAGGRARAARLGGLPHAPDLCRGPDGGVRGPDGRGGLQRRRHRRHHWTPPGAPRTTTSPGWPWAASPKPFRRAPPTSRPRPGYGLDVEHEARSARIASDGGR